MGALKPEYSFLIHLFASKQRQSDYRACEKPAIIPYIEILEHPESVVSDGFFALIKTLAALREHDSLLRYPAHQVHHAAAASLKVNDMNVICCAFCCSQLLATPLANLLANQRSTKGQPKMQFMLLANTQHED